MAIMLAGLRGIDEEIWKAARVDGIPTWRTYLFIVMPMMAARSHDRLRPAMRQRGARLRSRRRQTGGGPGIASEMPAKLRHRPDHQRQNVGQGMAAATMMLLPIVIDLVLRGYSRVGGASAAATTRRSP